MRPTGTAVPLLNSSSQAEGAKYLAQVENVELFHKNEAIKIPQLREGFLKLSKAYVKPANKCVITFEAQQEVSHQLPDVHIRGMKELKYTGSDACKEVAAKAQGRVQLYKRHNYLLPPQLPLKLNQRSFSPSLPIRLLQSSYWPAIQRRH
ncbi:hypothetical protein AVEN_164236-1 [Araneus ventricosus]|uniref:Uncharacterized protein n=1 Tax=Araneus ventricosus TaxID=182803 RepID=A0A4Y2IDT3_ARAVE|nr:hypothetical protein AVEN_164236-1 [Araneus ventricosus]